MSFFGMFHNDSIDYELPPSDWDHDVPFRRSQDINAANMMMFSALFGIVFNFYTMYIIRRNKSLHTPFGALTVSRSISNTGTLSIFVLWSAPVCYLGHPFLPFKSGVRFGNFGSFTYNAVIYHEPMVALDRFIATFLPTKYDVICGKWGTAIKIGFAWIVGFCTAFPETLDGCHFRFDYWSLQWSYMDLPCARFIEQYFFMSASYGCHGVALLLNICILFKLGSNYYRLGQQKKVQGQGYGQERKRLNMLIRNFVQSLLQDLVYVVMVALIQITGRTVNKTRFEDFVVYSWFWEMCHVLDGVIVVFYRPEMRNPIKKAFRRIFCFDRNVQSADVIRVARARGANFSKIGSSSLHMTT